MVKLFCITYTLYIDGYLAHHEIVRAKFGNSGIRIKQPSQLDYDWMYVGHTARRT